MNYNTLIYYALSFVEVVKAGNFSSAAKKSGVSKAQLSRHVSILEDMLGIQLLHRTTRKMVLTEQGKQFFESCQLIEESCAEAVSNIKQDFSAMHGTLRITAPIDFGIQFLPPLIDQFSKLYPDINITVSLSNVNENLIEEGHDLALRIANQLPDSSLRMLTVMQFKRIFCASPDYFNDKRIPQSPDELRNYHCITSVNRNMNIMHPQWQFQMKGKLVNYPLEKFLEIDSLYAQIQLVKSASGIGRLPDYFIRRELESGVLKEIFNHIEKPVSYVYLLYPNTRILPQKTRIFIEYLKNLNPM